MIRHQFRDSLRKQKNGEHDRRAQTKKNQTEPAPPPATTPAAIQLPQAHAKKNYSQANQPRPQGSQSHAQAERPRRPCDPQRQTTRHGGKRAHNSGRRRQFFRVSDFKRQISLSFDSRRFPQRGANPFHWGRANPFAPIEIGAARQPKRLRATGWTLDILPLDPNGWRAKEPYSSRRGRAFNFNLDDLGRDSLLVKRLGRTPHRHGMMGAPGNIKHFHCHASLLCTRAMAISWSAGQDCPYVSPCRTAFRQRSSASASPASIVLSS